MEYAKKSLNGAVGERVELVPFDYSRRRMSVVIKRNDKYLLICKGAPESIIQASSKMKLNGRIVKPDPTLAEESAEKLFRKGFRVISVAAKDAEKTGLRQR